MVSDRGPATEVVTIIFTVIATVFVAARFYTRAFLVRSIKQEDWWMLAAWVVAVAFSASICVGVRFGLGRHGSDIPEHDKTNLRKAEYAFSVLYNPSLMLTKTSIIVFFLSVMSKDVDPIFKWLNWITLAVVNIAGLALTFLNIFQCGHVSAGYTYPTPENAHCHDIIALYQSSAPVNIITDLAILLLPVPILTRLRLPRKQKIILLVTFGFGVFVMVVDVIRIAYLQSAALDRFTVDRSEGSARIVESNDFPWYAALSFMWSAVEVNVGIICACVPCLKPLFARFLPSWIRSSSDMSTRGDSLDIGKDEKLEAFSSGPPPDADPITHPAAFHRPSCAEYLGDDDGDEMGFLNMLKGPPSDTASPRTSRFTMVSRTATNRSTVSDFGFVKMGGTRNMLKLNNRQSIWPVAVVTIVFFLWGFAYGLLDVLNSQFQTIAQLSAAQGHVLHSAYYGGYLIGPLTVGRFILKRYGFKASMIAGLCIYGCGTLIFWPSAVLNSFPAFVVSNFIVGFGLACLEISANPYTALCGPLEYAEVRLNFSQAFQAIGTVVSPLLARKVLFKNVLNAPSLVNVQWTYLGIAIFVFLLAIIFYYIPLPEATDDQLEELAEKRESVYRTRVGPFRVVWVTLALGVFCQWCYVGSQEAVSNAATSLMQDFAPIQHLSPRDYVTVAHTVFAIGRFMAAFMNYVMTPRWILLVLISLSAVFTGLQVVVRGNAAAAMLMMTYLAEAGIFSIIFAICMRGMGAHTKTASAFMTAAISGGAVIPVIQWALNNHFPFPRSYVVVPALYVAAVVFPLYLNLVPAARKQVDPVHEKGRNRRGRRIHRTVSTVSDPAGPTRQFGLVGIIARRRKQKRFEEATAEHIECASEVSPTTKFSRGFDEKDFIESPSPVHSVTSKHPFETLRLWRSHGSKKSRDSTSTESDRNDTNAELTPTGAAPQPTVPRPWTEQDDAIDDYHNALKGI